MKVLIFHAGRPLFHGKSVPMNHIRTLLSIFFVVSFMPKFVPAQDFPIQDTTHVVIVSEPEGAEIYSGHSFLGVTPLRIEKRQGKSIDVYFPGKASFFKEKITLDGKLPSAAQGVVRLTFKTVRRIETIPFGAEIFINDSLVGQTPVDLPVPANGAIFHVRKAGYKAQAFQLASDDRSPLILPLLPLPSLSAMSQVQEYTAPQAQLKTYVLIPSAVGLGSTVAAIMLKHRANGYYSDYLESYNGAAFNNAIRYDRFSGIALIITQLTLGYFLYLLFR